MEQHNGNKNSTPIDVRNEKNDGIMPKHIQVNLSKEYFTALADQDGRSPASDDENAFQILSENASIKQYFEDLARKESDNESGVTPIIHNQSPIKGIIKSINHEQSPNQEMTTRKDVSFSPSKKSNSSKIRSPKSPKKVRITEPGKDTSLKGAQSITEIEGIRTQLKHMIELTKVQNSSGNPQQMFKENQSEQELSYLDDSHQIYGETKKQFESMASLRGLLSYTAPPLQMDEHGIMRGSGTDLSETERISHEFISPGTDRSLMLENSMLKENLEREKQRRKHCEVQIQSLQKKVLEMQQQLAVAVATDRKKAIMIEQLDKTLANIVAGWKKQEADKIKTIQKLREENSMLRKSQKRQQELLEQFEKELAQAVESLTKEQAKTKVAEKEKKEEIKRHQELREEAYEKLQKEREVLSRLNEDIEHLVSEKSELNKQLSDLEEQTEENRNCWMNEREDLTSAVEKAKERFTEQISQLQDSLSSAKKETQDANSKATSCQHEVQNLQLELDTALREKESLKVEVGLLEAKIDAVKTKQESEQRAVLEEEFNEKINIIQDEIMRTESQLKTTHKDQILELNRRHKDDLELQLKRFHDEINKRENQMEKMKKDFEMRLSEAHGEIQVLTGSKAKLEAHRKELTRRLQSLMQQHIQEAVSLISFENGSQTPSTKQIADALNQQMYGFKNESFLPSLHQETPHESNQLSSTLTEYNDKSHKLRDSVSSIRSTDNHSLDIMGRLFGPEGSKVSRNGPGNLESFAEERGDMAVEMSNRLGQVHPRSMQNFGSKDGDQTVARPSYEDSFSWREEQFQSGLQSLSDKLRHSRNDFSLGLGTQEQKPSMLEDRRATMEEERKEQTSNWQQIQDLVKSKLDELTHAGVSQHEVRDLFDDQSIKYGGRDVFADSKLDNELADQEDRQIKLTSFIKTLLNKSPGNPTEDENDDEYDEFHRQREKDTIQSGSRDLLIALQNRDVPSYDQRKQFESLPIGSDSVSKDYVDGNLKTPPRAARTSSLTHAFKKSILKDRPSKPSLATDTNMEHTPRRSPHKTREKMQADEGDVEKQQKQQLLNLLGILGIQESTSAKDLSEMVNMISAIQKSQLQQKQRPKGAVTQLEARKTAKLSTNPKSKSQVHKQHKLQQKTQADEIFSRLQKIYGTSEGPPSERLGSAEPENKISGQRLALAVKGQSHQSTKSGKIKDQRKGTVAVKQPMNAWK